MLPLPHLEYWIFTVSSALFIVPCWFIQGERHTHIVRINTHTQTIIYISRCSNNIMIWHSNMSERGQTASCIQYRGTVKHKRQPCNRVHVHAVHRAGSPRTHNPLEVILQPLLQLHLVHGTDREMMRPESDGEWGRRGASTSGGEVRVLHGVEAVNRGEQWRVSQGQAVAISHVTQRVRVHGAVETLKT